MKIVSFTPDELFTADELFELMGGGVDYLSPGPASAKDPPEFPYGEFAPQANIGPLW